MRFHIVEAVVRIGNCKGRLRKKKKMILTIVLITFTNHDLDLMRKFHWSFYFISLIFYRT